MDTESFPINNKTVNNNTEQREMSFYDSFLCFFMDVEKCK